MPPDPQRRLHKTEARETADHGRPGTPGQRTIQCRRPDAWARNKKWLEMLGHEDHDDSDGEGK
jgi:hypothetical protein